MLGWHWSSKTDAKEERRELPLSVTDERKAGQPDVEEGVRVLATRGEWKLNSKA
jgi:hypothetical protein